MYLYFDILLWEINNISIYTREKFIIQEIMDDRFTSFSKNEERFGFYSGGIINCSYPFEDIFLIGVTALAIILYMILNSIAVNNNSQNQIQTLQYLVIFIMAPAVGIAVFLFGTGFILAGIKLTYKADEFKFTISYPNDRQPPDIIYYDLVSSVSCKQRHLLLFIDRGLDIKIKTKDGKEYNYQCIHNSISKGAGIKALPFYIIQERSSQKIP